jgi:hypothetical protein
MRFENCIYDNLQLADRFLVCSERLLRARRKALINNKPIFVDLEYGVFHFGFSHPVQLLRWKVKYDHIFNDGCAKFQYLMDDGRGFILCALINPTYAFEIAKHYIGVAERLMNMEDK